MSEQLRWQYLAFLDQYGLEPRPLPPDRNTLQKAVAGHLVAQSKAAGDEVAAALYEETYRRNQERYRQEARHPANILIEDTARYVEQSISAIERYRQALQVDVFAGEFPTGSINAQAVEAEGGFLMLVNSGLLVVVEQVVEFLSAGDPDKPADRAANGPTIDGVVDVLTAYLRFGDPFFGPKPMSGGLKFLLRHALSRATQAFVVAHEYGHVIAGHFNDQVTQLEQILTRVGPISAIKKDWAQEFEADRIASKILLGVEDYAQLDLAAIDAALAPHETRGSVLARGLELKAAIAAPSIFLTLDAILADVMQSIGGVTILVRPDMGHPPARERMDNLLPAWEGLKPRYSGFINYAAILWEHFEEITWRIVQALSAAPE